MLSPRVKVAVVIGALVVLAPRTTSAQPAETPEPESVLPVPTTHLLLRTGPGTLLAPDGNRYLLPPLTHILTPPAWEENETEFTGLQERVIRLEAENKSLRQSAGDVPWLPIAIGVGLGIVAGGYVGYRIAR